MATYSIDRLSLLYSLARSEGEGFGTAYEYYVRLRFLRVTLGLKKIHNMLIAGLPEKYGFGLDLFLWAGQGNSRLLVIDEREEVIRRCEALIVSLRQQRLIRIGNIEFRKVTGLSAIPADQRFDLAVSSCVIQRLSDRQRYIEGLCRHADTVMVFGPNGYNHAHKMFTHLRTVQETDFFSLSGKRIMKIGFLDMPPFSPGITAKKCASGFDKAVRPILFVLRFWYYVERFMPYCVKRKHAHILYGLMR